MLEMKDKVQLFKGDCLEVMKDIKDKSVDMILCDLPYGTTKCKWDSIIPFDRLWEQYNRIIKDNGAIVLFGIEPFSSRLRMSNIENYKYDWYWNKTKPVGFANAKKMPLKDVETIGVYYKRLPTYNPQGLIKCNRTISNSTKQLKHNNISAINGGKFKTKTFIQEHTNYPRQILRFSVEQGLHPTQKPVELLEYLIKTYTNEGEVILDNCMGSGSTGVACLNTNRKFIGIELDDTYFDIAYNRINGYIYNKTN
ncbi:MAG: site-specific DNA-methyltransferase [Clostridium perfringens]|nr:site-specific DNA-methyltransferase [Clostridium perfringens]